MSRRGTSPKILLFESPIIFVYNIFKQATRQPERWSCWYTFDFCLNILHFFCLVWLCGVLNGQIKTRSTGLLLELLQFINIHPHTFSMKPPPSPPLRATLHPLSEPLSPPLRATPHPLSWIGSWDSAVVREPRLPPIWPGFHSSLAPYLRVKFVAGSRSRLAARVFLRVLRFSSLYKN